MGEGDGGWGIGDWGLGKWGDFYRGKGSAALPSVSASMSGCAQEPVDSDNFTEWTCVSKDREKAVGMVMQRLVVPNSPFHCYHARGLEKDALYHFYNRVLKIDVREFGDLVNTVSPIHVKKDSLLLDIIAKFVKMDGETEDYTVSGDTIMKGGIHLRQAFGATGYNGEVRHFQDFGSRIYFMEKQ